MANVTTKRRGIARAIPPTKTLEARVATLREKLREAEILLHTARELDGNESESNLESTHAG
jgi:sugar-specific transcriptional regulator TrmB